MEAQKDIFLSLDYGTKYTGYCLYDRQQDPFPMPSGRISYQNDQQLLAEVCQLAIDHKVTLVVLGIPRYLNGDSSQMTIRVEGFGKLLKQSLPCSLVFQDESLTSYEAEDRMKNSPLYHFKVNKDKVDALSAVIILEDFLRAQGHFV